MFFRRKNKKLKISKALAALQPNDKILFNPHEVSESVYEAIVLNNHPESKRIYIKFSLINDTFFVVKIITSIKDNGLFEIK